MKKIKVLLPIVALLIVGYCSWSIFIIIKNRHHVEMTDYSPYMWIFNDSVKNDVDTNIFVGSVREKDILYQYILKRNYHISVWEFKDLQEISLNEIPINSNVDLSELDIIPYELLNKNESPEITVELGFSFHNSMSLNIDTQSKIIKQIDTPKYKGFYGVVNKLSLSNEKGKHLIIFDYSRENQPTVFLFYKTAKSFYVIIINSRNIPFDESVIRLLNLK